MDQHEPLASPRSFLHWDINNLVRELRQERLFVSSEQNELQKLNERVVNDSIKLAQSAWVTSQQRLNLNRLILSRPDSSPAICCQKANALESTRFVDAFKVLPYQDCLVYGEFLQNLRASPELLAQCFALGEQICSHQALQVVPSLISGLYGSLVLPHDTVLVLRLLRQLTKLKLINSDNPRRMLRNSSCSFFRLYSEFHEGLFTSKLFLTAVLQSPIIQLLTDIEYFLDIDPDKAVERFPVEDRVKKFGKEGTPEYNARIAKYRKWTINSLEAITTKFITSLKENLYCFPAPLSWLIKQIMGFLSKSGNFNAQEINAMITDLVFTHFICPAMVNPEPYGIIDTPISYISRFNLIQVARIIQMLALHKYQEVDSKVSDLYNLFDKECVSSLLEAILQDASESLEEVPLAIDSVELQGMVRSSALFTEIEIYNLIGFLQTISQALEQTSDEASAIPVTSPATNVGLEMFSLHDREKLTVLLSGIPARPLNGVTQNSSTDSLSKLKKENDDLSVDSGNKKSSILGKVSKPRLNKLALLNSDSNQNINGMVDDHNAVSQNSNSRPSSSGSDDCQYNQDVLIIPLNVPQGELVGLLPEQKVLSMELSNGFSSSTNLDSVTLTNNVDDFVSEQDSEERDQIVTETAGMVLATGQEKRTRFSHSHDEGSIGNISDNLEAISEAASNHSVASSLELEENEDQNDNDNLSDMISANVSGRGTPNISGRDTPSSQVTEDENDARQMGVEARLQFAPVAQPLINKQIRSEIDDKFCKFEIKKLLEGDETVSIISDTWSTDVLASDSETIEASERDRPVFMPPVIERLERVNVVEGLDRLDAVSESAWSTDVLASDSERMTEVDTDDTASVAPSDDTASVARSDDTARSEIEDTPPVQIHRPIPISLPSNSNASTSNNHLNNGPVSASSSQPDSPLDIPLPLNYNMYLQNSPHYNGSSNPNFSPSNAFRPIQEGRDSITPNSPMRNIISGTPTSSNITGKGGRKSDYQRRTMEYVHNNANNIHMRSAIERNQIIRSTSEQSTMTRSTETIEHRSSSILRNSSNHSENSSRREAILIDSNSICMNGLELLLEEKERKIISNSYKSTESSTLVRQVSTPNEFPQIPNQKSNGTKKMDDICDGVRLSNISLNSTSSSLTSSSSGSDSNKKSSKMNGNHADQWNNNHTSNIGSQTQWYQNHDNMSVSTPTKSENELVDISNNLPSSSSALDSVLSVTVPSTKANNNVAVQQPPTSAIKPQMASTGAIPKSISFDMTAEKGDKDMLDDDQKNKRGFFGKLKMGFKNRRGKSVRGSDDLSAGRYEGGDGDPPRFKRYTAIEDPSTSMRPGIEETSEDILAKYRRKPSNNSDTNTSDSISISAKLKSTAESTAASAISNGNDERWLIDHNNIENCFAFSDAKRKLRIVLSTASEHSSSWDMNVGQRLRAQNNNGPPENELVLFLRLQLAKARNLCDWPLVTLINETLRCIALFDLNECRKLLLALRQEHAKRGAYIRYLVRCRQELYATLAHIDSLNMQIIADRKLTTGYLVAVCVRMFLERREPAVISFCEEFKNLTLADEKTDLLYSFMETLATEMDKDVNWKDASESQLELARTAIERTLISRVYMNALFPNGDGDISRDQMLYDHMKKLSKIISPNHKDLRIHSVYHYECPWTSAQNAIAAIAAYKTAADKVRCVMRCATAIMNLLSLASERGVPTADDFTPVLVYVLIKANPPSLLSTIQYVNSFYGNRLQGEEQYWWIQFCSVVEFIKTMDYSD